MGDGAPSRPLVRRNGGPREAIRGGAARVHTLPQESVLFQLDWASARLHVERGKLSGDS